MDDRGRTLTGAAILAVTAALAAVIVVRLQNPRPLEIGPLHSGMLGRR